MPELFGVTEAARLLGMDPSHVRRLLRQGKIEGKRLGHDWVVLSLDYERKRKFGGGRKSKK
jgi:excisionase family DNA binding protein